jgi:biopolymer transport protein ExbD
MARIPVHTGLRQSSSGEEAGINLTPLIDIIFILIFFFFLSMQVRTDIPSVAVNLPNLTNNTPPSGASQAPQQLIITIAADGSIYLDSSSVATPREELSQRLSQIRQSGVEEVKLRVDDQSRSGLLLDVFKQCQEVGFLAVDVPFLPYEPN